MPTIATSNVYGSYSAGAQGQSSSRDDDPPNLHINRTDYIINVKTSDRFGAGTDANVYVQLHGESGLDSEHLLLSKSSQNRNKFERGQYDQFTFTDQRSIGQLKSIKIWHDNTGIGASWHLEYVEISDTGSGRKYRFPCHRWLSTTEEDGQVSREIKCTEVSAGPKYTIQTATGVLKNNSSSSIGSMAKPDSSSALTGATISSSSSTVSSSSSPSKFSVDHGSSSSAMTKNNIENDDSQAKSCLPQQQQQKFSNNVSIINNVSSGGGGCHKSSLIQAHHKVEVFSPKPDSRRSSSTSVASNASSGTTISSTGGTGSMYGPFYSTGSNHGSSSTTTLSLGPPQPVRKSSQNSMYGPYSKR